MSNPASCVRSLSVPQYAIRACLIYRPWPRLQAWLGITQTSTTLAGVSAETLIVECDGPIVLYLHGGGYVIGSPRPHRHLAAKLALEIRGTVISSKTGAKRLSKRRGLFRGIALQISVDGIVVGLNATGATLYEALTRIATKRPARSTHYPATQFSIFNLGTRENSPTLFVTKMHWFVNA